MKAQRIFPVAIFLIFAAALVFWLTARNDPRQLKATSYPTPTASADLLSPASPNAAPPPPAPASAVPGSLPSSAPDPAAPPESAPAATAPRPTPDRLRADIEDVQLVLRDFRTGLGENPVGSNAEITTALLGDNLKQLKLEVPAGSQLNAAGELCDRFSTPYFFHQLSASQMEVRSAGPDRKMWTADDVQK